MTVLVTGALGYIGNEVIKKLLSTNTAIIAVDINDEFLHLWGDRIQYIHGDICDMACPKEADIVVHLAAEVGFLACDKNSDKANRTNIEGTRNVASWKKPTLFFSTGSVYGNLNETCTENSPCTPGSIYAKTKLEGESIIKTTEYCIVRPATAYGISYKNRDDLLIHNLTKLALQGSVELYQPNAVRTVYSVYKIAEFVSHAVSNWSLVRNKTLNLGNEAGTLSKKQIIDKINSLIDFSITIVDGCDPDGRDYKVDYSKLKEVWPNSEDKLDDYLQSIVDHYKNSLKLSV